MEATRVTREIYANPPIVEAVIDFRFSTDVTGDALVDALTSALGEEYSGPRKAQRLLKLEAQMPRPGDDGGVSASATTSTRLVFLQTPDQRRLLGCGDGMLSVHVMAPYPGWEAFVALAREAVDSAGDLLSGQPLDRIAVRYIDRIPIALDPKAGGPRALPLVAGMPVRPRSMPAALRAFHYVTETVDPSDGTVAALRIASAPLDEHGRPMIVYDLDMQRTGSPVCTLIEHEWIRIADELHERQREIFEDSITEELRESFR